jgi:hypothetical protein
MLELVGLEPVLEEVAAAHLDSLLSRVENSLEPRERLVLAWLMERYKDPSLRRWYDPYHVLFSTAHALKLVACEGADRLIVTGALLHDVGYSALDDLGEWNRPESRFIHMQEGAALTAGLACRLGYHAEEVQALVGMVGVHDNPYVGLPIHGSARLALRDCDRAFVMHLLSFYKDWSQKQTRYPEPDGFLRERLIQFYGGDVPFGGEGWAATEEELQRNAIWIERPVYSLTRTLVERQFKQRIAELEGNASWRDPDLFREYALHQVDHEFFLGR